MVTTNVSGEASADDRVRGALQKIRLPAALALLAVNALWLLLALERLLVPSDGGLPFSDRSFFAFDEFAGLRPIVLPLLAVLLAVAVRPALGALTRPIVFAALAEYGVSLLFALVALLGSLFRSVGARGLVESAFADLGWLALLGVATLCVVWVALAVLGPRKPKAPTYPGGAPWPGAQGGPQQQYGQQPPYPAEGYGQQYPGQAGYAGYEQQQSYGQQAPEQHQQHQPYPSPPAQAPTSAPAAHAPYAQAPSGQPPAAPQHSYEQPASGIPQSGVPHQQPYEQQQSYAHQAYDQQQGYAQQAYQQQQQSYPAQPYEQQSHPAQGGQQTAPAPSWPAYGQSGGQPSVPTFTMPAPQVSSPPMPSSDPAEQGPTPPAQQASGPPASTYGRATVGTAAVPPPQPWLPQPVPTEQADPGSGAAPFPPPGSWSQQGAGDATNVVPSGDPAWPTPPPEPAARWNAAEDEADPTERVSRNGGDDHPRWRDTGDRNRGWGQPDQP